MSKSSVKFQHSIRFRLSAMMAAVIFIAMCALSIFNASNSFSRETENFRTFTQGAASAYAATVADAVYAGDETQTLSALRGIRDLPNVAQVDITMPNGDVFTELGTGAWIVSDEADKTSLWQRKTLRVALPIVKGGEEIGTLGMLADIQPLRREILRTLYITIVSGLIIGVFGILLAQVFVSHLTAPIRQLTDAMVRIRETDVQHHTMQLRGRQDETGLLTNSFSDMIDTIRDRDQQIADHMDSLEQTVEERTHDLRLARDDAEAANAAKSDFLATMSHEIRTPMNGMMVMAEMLGAADLTPRHKRYAEIIHRSGNSLLTIINDILDLSKIEAGQLDLEMIPVSPEDLITDVASLFWERARGKGLELATYVAPDVPQQVLADPTRLNQIISNLVNNALKFTEQGGVLIRLEAETRAQGACGLTLNVIDTGIGIPEDKIDHIFESFSQADQSTTRKFGGTGLGLTVCQRLVTAMGGEISVTSELGKGSVFSVTFETSVTEIQPPMTSTPISIGLALDDGPLRQALAQSLADAGIELCATSPALWIATSSQFAAKDAPVVLLSDIGDTQADEILKSGKAVDLLPNPYKRSDIAALLAKAVAQDYRGAEALANSSSSIELGNFDGMRILAVDDNAVNREVLREALSTLNADATFAENGQQALALFKASTFDLVFMDGSMPVMDGFDATRAIRSFESTRGRPPTPLFALTAQVAGSDEIAWQDAGADGHILKPFTLDKLSSVLSGTAPQGAAPVTQNETCEADDLLDTDTVQTLEQLGDASETVRDRIWKMFFDKAPDMIATLKNAVDTGENIDVAHRAHALKSMALSAGFKAVSEHLQRLEETAKVGALDQNADDTLGSLEALIARTQLHTGTYMRAAS
ncbi:MAG: ATP-binding protein [Pseudomonadota bacterium]